MKPWTLVAGTLLAILAPLFLLWPSVLKSRLRAMPELAAEYPSLPSWQTGKVLMVFAHADDELGVVAQVARMMRDNPELEVKWALVTDSGKGFTFPGSCKGRSAAECRLDEARAVARCMGIPEPVSLDLPDGGLADIVDLATLLREGIPELDAPDLRAVFTNDNRGLYGHADHVAIHDAVAAVLAGRDVPLVSMALTEAFHALLPMKEPGASRPRMPITHAYDLQPRDVELKACTFAAHASQVITLRLQMMLGIQPRDFFTWAPREFFTLQRPERVADALQLEPVSDAQHPEPVSFSEGPDPEAVPGPRFLEPGRYAAQPEPLRETRFLKPEREPRFLEPGRYAPHPEPLPDTLHLDPHAPPVEPPGDRQP